MFDVDEPGRPAVEREPGAGNSDNAPAEGRLLRDVGEGPEADSHLVEPEGCCRGKTDPRHTQLCTGRTLSQRHVCDLR